jgi:hypothetical protein
MRSTCSEKERTAIAAPRVLWPSALGLLIAALLLAAPALAQGTGPAGGTGPDPVLPGLHPQMHITIEPVFPIGPALDTDKGGMYGGLGGSVGFNFVRDTSKCMGVDGQLLFAVPILETDTTTGSWVQLSGGIPMRFGHAVSFFFRPGLAMEILDHHHEHYMSGADETHTNDFDSAVGIGLSLAIGLDININDRIGIGLAFGMDILAVPLQGEHNWYSGTVPLYNHYSDITGYITTMGLWRIMIRF